jgi:hypothetical protein
MRRIKTMGRWCCLALALAGVVAGGGCQTSRGLTSAPTAVRPFAQQWTGAERWGDEAGVVLPCRH